MPIILILAQNVAYFQSPLGLLWRVDILSLLNVQAKICSLGLITFSFPHPTSVSLPQIFFAGISDILIGILYFGGRGSANRDKRFFFFFHKGERVGCPYNRGQYLWTALKQTKTVVKLEVKELYDVGS